MKLRRVVFFALVLGVLSLSAGRYSHRRNSEMSSSSASAESINAFLGRWDLTLKAPDREYPSWLELREEEGQLKAQMVSRWGNARPLPKVESVEWPPHFRFSQRGGSPARGYGLRRNASWEDAVGDYQRAERNHLAMDRPESAGSKENRCPGVGKADPVVQRKRSGRMEDEQIRCGSVEGRRR